VELATEVERRVYDLKQKLDDLNSRAYELWVQENGALPDTFPEDEIRDQAAWGCSEKLWHSWFVDDGETIPDQIAEMGSAYQRLQTEAVELSEYLQQLSVSIQPQVDAFTGNTTATTLQQCLHRLQHLQTWFRKVQHSQELVDAMQEGGHILAQLVRSKCLSADDLLPGADRTELVALAGYVSKALADRRTGKPMETEGLARVSQRELWELVTYRQRPPDSFDSEALYQWLASEFSRITNLLIIKLQRVTAAAQKASSPTGGTDRKELESKLRQLISNGYRYSSYSALTKKIGGSKGTWTNIFRSSDNGDLREWRDNRSVYARNSPSAEQASYKDPEYIPDEDLEPLFAKELKASQLPRSQHSEVLEWFRKRSPDEQRNLLSAYDP
jgi:hypothetical protein